MTDTIIALATAPFKSALALIRVSGTDAFDITRRLFSKPNQIDGSRRMAFGTLRRGNEDIDEVMLFLYPRDSSMTGEEVVEISCHGSMLIIEEIVSAFLAEGARYAKPGEFSERAFLSGKMDLVEAESVNELINATTKEGKDLALLSLKGKSSALAQKLKKELGDLLSLIEVNIDYPEYEDIEIANEQKVRETSRVIRDEIKNLIATGEEGKILKEGLSVAIVGEPNVGKSSLLNALLREDKAIVSPIPGTTRDLVEGDFSLKGIPFHLLDTAGIHETNDFVESLGVKKSEETLRRADIVIHVLSAQGDGEDSLLEALKGKRVIDVYNKKDLIPQKERKEGRLYVSALEGDVESLKDALVKAAGVGEASYSSPSLSNARQLGLLRQVDATLAKAEKEAADGVPMDLISGYIQKAFNDVQTLLGEEVTTDLTDEIFSRFCIGK